MSTAKTKSLIFGVVSVLLIILGGRLSVWVIDRVGIEYFADWSRYLAFLYLPLVGIVIQLIMKLHNIVDIDLIRYEQLKRLAPVVKEKTKRLWVLCGFYVLSAVISVLFPLVSELDKSLAYFGALFVGMCLIVAVPLTALVALWFEEVRELKWKLAAANKADSERGRLLKEMRETTVDQFTKDDSLDGGKRVRH